MPTQKIVKMSGDLAFISVEDIPDQMLPEWLANLDDPTTKLQTLGRTSEFLDEIRAYDLHDLLGLTALYTLKKFVIKDGHRTKYPEPSDLEILQALLLSFENKDKKTPIPRERVSEFWLELLRQNYTNAHSDDREGRSWLDALAASHIAYYRNPYGDDFFDRMLTVITAEYDERYLRDGSFTMAGKALVYIRSTIWGRFKKYFESLAKSYQWDRNKTLNEVYRLRDLLGVSIDGLGSDCQIDELKPILINLMEDYAVKTMFLLDEDWLESTEKSGLPVRKTLEKISMVSMGKLDGFEGLARSNPILSKPFIKSVDGYHLYSLMTLLSQPFSILLNVLGESAEAKKRIENIRGWFAEIETSRLLKQSFPSGHQALSGYWQRNTEERVESDLIVLVDNHVLIFEAKGALITERVRSGSRGAMQQFLKKTWGKSTKQGAALANHLKTATTPVVIEDKKGSIVLSLDPQKIRTVSRFSVSVEQVGPFMNSPQLLKDMKVIDDEDSPAPCIILSELGLVFKSLKEEIQRLHYLTRRFSICQKHQIVGDEMDIFSLYLQTGFIDLPDINQPMMLLGASYEISELQRDDGTYRTAEKCPINNSKYFKSLLATMKRRNSPAYFDVGLLVLDMPLDDQLKLEIIMKKEFIGKPSLDESPAICAKINNLFDGFVVCGMYFGDKVHQAQRREAALNMLGGLGSLHKVQEGFIFVRLPKKNDAYDALYFSGRLFCNG